MRSTNLQLRVPSSRVSNLDVPISSRTRSKDRLRATTKSPLSGERPPNSTVGGRSVTKPSTPHPSGRGVRFSPRGRRYYFSPTSPVSSLSTPPIMARRPGVTDPFNGAPDFIGFSPTSTVSTPRSARCFGSPWGYISSTTNTHGLSTEAIHALLLANARLAHSTHSPSSTCTNTPRNNARSTSSSRSTVESCPTTTTSSRSSRSRVGSSSGASNTSHSTTTTKDWSTEAAHGSPPPSIFSSRTSRSSIGSGTILVGSSSTSTRSSRSSHPSVGSGTTLVDSSTNDWSTETNYGGSTVISRSSPRRRRRSSTSRCFSRTTDSTTQTTHDPPSSAHGSVHSRSPLNEDTHSLPYRPRPSRSSSRNNYRANDVVVLQGVTTQYYAISTNSGGWLGEGDDEIPTWSQLERMSRRM